ncbi:exodeoxyribonuclease V subunit beta [Tenacibaculum sp. SG-28]|uniref:UvrD-helicase domain-containing protein n=1 Tax=Tenacibaculum sp. SG-28 TaxID=754426 RepID=UPI001E36D0E0|nr:UvrD-helicase domain-containing protein [Tenacibaculum sp. SG-28]
MQQLSTFTVYNASAGSGKTFTLVKEYLKILLQSENIFLFQKILAVTFTNKAAGEMKERVLDNLREFSEGNKNDLAKILLEEIPTDFATVQKRSTKILNAILQNYTSFSITTIDSFTHKIIKSFAYDLGLSLHFEVEMDALSLLEEAVDVLISKIGTDKEITNLLIQFSLDKADDDKSWDISRELHEISKILLQEDDAENLKQLSTKHVKDFLLLKEKLKTENETIEKEFLKIVKELTSLLKANNLEVSDFAYAGEYVKHFLKFKEIRYLKSDSIKFNGRLHKTITEDKNLYAGKTSKEAKARIENLTPELHALYYSSEQVYQKHYGRYLKNRLILKNIIPLAVLNNINAELASIKEDNNIRLNAEFNHLIANHIKDQPAPYIYERIGQRFMHYFIDEMQDTSALQWKNLTPLIDNALAQESSSLLLVGDGKQAIYRWRGGKAEQFIHLSATNPEFKNPFQVPKTSKSLDTNYRSFEEIISFNNSFFQHSAKFLHKESYKNLYVEGNSQKYNTREGGYVSLSFLDKIEDKEENSLKYPREVLEKIKSVHQEFDFDEICVLVRKRSDGIAVANYLSENGIPIVSSETLLLKNDPKVLCITHLFHLIQNPTDRETLFAFLYFLHDHLAVNIDKHSFIASFLDHSLPDIFELLREFGITFDLKKSKNYPFTKRRRTLFALLN